jgi:predicted Fe-Mo cluster-binding NifX family protein
MSCYFRILKDILAEAGIEVTPANRKQVDQAIHRVVGVEYKDCPAAGRAVKQRIIADKQKRRDFVKNLKEAMR